MNCSSYQIRTILLYEFKNGLKASEAARKIRNVFGGDCVSDPVARFWFRRFKSGEQSLENEARSGRPLTFENDEIRECLRENPRATCKEIGEILECDESTARKRLHTLGFSKKLDKWVPHKLTENNKLSRFSICNCLLIRVASDPFIDRIVTCDEKWVTYDNSRRSGQWVERGKAPGTSAKKEIHQRKILVTVWWTARGIVHVDYLPRGQTITSDIYCAQITTVHQKLLENQASLVNRKGVLLLHDNARPHVAIKTREKLKEVGWEILPHPPYSPDISPTDYHLFLALSNFLANQCFTNDDQVKTALDRFFSSKNQEFYSRGMNSLVERWQKVVECNGDYFVE